MKKSYRGSKSRPANELWRTQQKVEKLRAQLAEQQRLAEEVADAIQVEALRQYRHNDDNSSNLHTPHKGFVFAYDREEVDKQLARLNKGAIHD